MRGAKTEIQPALGQSNEREFYSSSLPHQTSLALSIRLIRDWSCLFPGDKATMASTVRQAMLRRSCHSLSAQPFPLPSPSLVNSLRPKVQTTSTLLPHRFPIAVLILHRSSIAAFHASARTAILPPGPQVIDGTANDPAPVPPPSPTHGSYHWTFERALSVGLIPLTIAPFAAGSLNPALDAVLIATILLHSHLGFS
jgi:succinate dehydrogenase (ubiquinone) membrane anchor subunit